MKTAIALYVTISTMLIIFLIIDAYRARQRAEKQFRRLKFHADEYAVGLACLLNERGNKQFIVTQSKLGRVPGKFRIEIIEVEKGHRFHLVGDGG